MARDENLAAQAEKIRQAILALEESLRLCRIHLRKLEAQKRAPDVRLERLFFKGSR